MEIAITEQEIGKAIIGVWFFVSWLLMLLPCISDRFKARYAGTAYGVFVIIFSMYIPFIAAVCLNFFYHLPLSDDTILSIAIK